MLICNTFHHRNEDVTATMYPGLQRKQQHFSEGGEGVEGVSEGDDRCDAEGHGNKVDRVCVALRKALNKLGANKYLLSVITTHVKMTTPELETVLGMIKQLKGKGVHVYNINLYMHMYVDCKVMLGAMLSIRTTI